ncbi:inositol 1,4,5-triphosphate receptor associated 2-like [Panthera onca]
MASARKVTDKRHNPVESICRKIRAIQKREEISDPIQQIIKYRSSRFDGPQTNFKKDFEEVLTKMAAAIPWPNNRFSHSEKDDAFISYPQITSPRTLTVSPLGSPENATHSVPFTSSENLSRPRSQSSQHYTSLVSQTRKGEPFSNKDLNNYSSENNLSALILDFDSTSEKRSECFTSQDSVGKNLSLNEAGSVGIANIIDYLRQTTRQNSEHGGLEELWNMLDPEKRDLHVDLETFHTIMKEWMTCCRNKWEGMSTGSSGRIDDFVFEQDSIKSSRAIKMTTDKTESTSWSFEALGGDVSKGVLEVSHLITYAADLHFNRQKLEEENNKLKLALETLEEANCQLSEECTELRLQIKSAHQANMRTNLLKEELEELKISMNASEEQKTMIIAQNKQLQYSTIANDGGISYKSFRLIHF